ncbi:MAG: Lcl domain-containing protein [Candidatus Electronema sp. V4]|uniref:Lcl domain-containing protein n=1 Tax=Candidatus Electronema sp. V4 TaxID=3454756 RepID=UPI0040558D25
MQPRRLFVLAVSVLIISACIVSSTAYSGNLLMMIAPLLAQKGGGANGDINTVVKLISVSSGSADSLTADWLPSKDVQTQPAQMRYTLHVSTDEKFLPSAATAKGTVVGKETLTVTGLQPNIQYFVLVAATDGSGNTSWSNRLQARTVATAAVRTSAVLAAQAQSQNPAVTPTTVTYSSSQAPAAGSYLASSVGSGYLRKVVSAASTNGVVTAQTAAASLNEVLQQYEISTVVKFAKVPASSPAPAMLRAAAGTGAASRQHNWTESGLTLTDSNQESADGKLVSKAAGKLIAASSPRMEQSVTGHYTNMTGPQYIAVMPWKPVKETVQARLKYDYGSQGREICKIVLANFTHDDPELAKLPPPTAVESLARDKMSGSLELSFAPDEKYIDDKNRPYEAYVLVYVDKLGDGCNGGQIWSRWEDVLEMKIPIYVTQGRMEVEDEEKNVTFSGDFSVTNAAKMTFEPELNLDLQLSGTTLNKADLIAKANIALSNTLTITANAAGNLSKTVPLLEPRSFVKMFPVGGVPVVVRGSFKMDARIDGHIGGAAKLTKFMELAFPDTSFGVQYRNGVWQEVKNFKPKYTFRIEGEADADAEISLTLLPDLQIHFYEAASGRMILEPSLYAEAALHGQFKYQDSNGNYLTDLDYWFPYVNAGVSLDMRLYAGLHVLDYNIASWPENVSYTETDKFKLFHPITRAEGKMYSLPTLTAAADEEPDNLPDSRAIFISGTATDYVTPLFGWKLNPFRAWTEPKVITDRQYAITPLDETLAEHWFIPKQAGDFTVRLGGYSKLGWFVRQVAEVPLSLPDTDADGLPDYWESRFGISSAAEDDDGDGLSNAAEFSHGTNPIEVDSDGGGVSDGQEIADGTNPLDGSDDLVQIRRVPLNDTGITWSGNYASGNNTACVASNTPDGDNVVAAQDCSHGRDATHNDDNDGHAGFSYTKLDSNGVPLADQSADYATTPWVCVRDNVTGLIWEVKTDNGGLHDKDDKYTWYNNDPKTNGGADGSADDGGNTCYGYDSSNSATFCNTQAYVNRVNADGWCGASDWRMPTRKELESLVRYDRSNPAIDTNFPNTTNDWYWSGVPYTDNSPYLAWDVSFLNGDSHGYYRYVSGAVRLVRSGGQ